MVEVRCRHDGMLLGRIEGKFEIKCRKCGYLNKGNTETGEQVCIMKSHIPLKMRKTSSGVTFR